MRIFKLDNDYSIVCTSESTRYGFRHLATLTKAQALSESLISKLIQTKTKRETAQYDATPSISKENAKTALEDADEFITRIEEILANE